jgi:hypothetical protein
VAEKAQNSSCNYPCFDQEAFAISLDDVNKFERSYSSLNESEQRRLELTSGIFKKIQSYDRVDAQGAGEKKAVYCITPSASVKAADVNQVEVEAQLGVSGSKKYVSHVIFTGGTLKFRDEYFKLLSQK